MKVKSQLIDAQLEARGSTPTKRGEIIINTASSNQVQYFDGTNPRTVANLNQSQEFTNKQYSSPVLNGNITGTGVADEDDMASNSATKVPTQQSVKAYVDSHSSETASHGATGAVVGTTNTQTLTNKTLTSPVLNGSLSGTAVVDEDDMTSDSATKVPTQQSVKAYVDNTISVGGGNPAGTVIASFSTSTPAGYLYCDGSTVSRATYSGLYTAIGDSCGNGDGSTTFHLPDLRGDFLRGQDDGRTADPDAGSRVVQATGGNTGDNVGSRQDSVFAAHNHGGGSHAHTAQGWVGGATSDAARFSTFQNNTGATNVNNPVTSASGVIIATEGGNETRPRNVYVRYYIKT